MDPLDAEEILKSIDLPLSTQLDQLQVFPSIDSTNTFLLNEPPPEAGRYRVAIAGQQTAGRGRMGRRWISPKDSGLYLSVAYTFRNDPQYVAALSLVAGICVAQTLRDYGDSGVSVKWPNDIVIGGAKLGGILIESRRAASDATTVVIGIGINMDLGDKVAMRDLARDRWGYADTSQLEGVAPARNELASALLNDQFNGVATFDSHGFAAFSSQWRKHDFLHGRDIEIEVPEGTIAGLAEGVDDEGALRLRTPQGLQSYVSASVLSW